MIIYNHLIRNIKAMLGDNVFDKIRYAIPVTLTAASLQFLNVPQLSSPLTENYRIPKLKLINYSWEEGYMPSIMEYYSSEQKIEIIQNFAINLVKEIEDIPPEFSKVIDEDFWDLV
jgi:hypothetical protein